MTFPSRPSINVVPLGAGQDVGRSCLLLQIGPKVVMLDCGMHMGYDDIRRFPDFSFISRTGDFTRMVDCVVISHFHLDHCGALPYFTEMCGYDGPVFMTHPTRAICPLLLEDYRRIATATCDPSEFFTKEDIERCMDKVQCINLRQTIRVDDGDLELTAYYAGHVLGAAMILIRYKDLSVVYTGDFNMTPDRHLGSASIDRLRPNLLITETTYGTTIRDSKRARERDFLNKVHQCVQEGGKVLIPVFALGRAQELCVLIDGYWERMGLRVPIYFAGGLTEKANHYYRLYTQWTNQTLKQSFSERNMFDYRHIKAFDMAYADQPGPQVLFASPGMLHAGYSLEVFKKWASDPKNMVILPGYCAPGTVGARVLAGEQVIELDSRTSIEVNLKIKHLSFSAHADAMGILQLIAQCQPENVMLVHGEPGKMSKLKEQIIKELQLPCYDPPNGTFVTVIPRLSVPVDISTRLLEEYPLTIDPLTEQSVEPVRVRGVLITQDSSAELKFVSVGEACGEFNRRKDETIQLDIASLYSCVIDDNETDFSLQIMRFIYKELCDNLDDYQLTIDDDLIYFQSITLCYNTLASSPSLHLSWLTEDEGIAANVKKVLSQYIIP